MIMKTSRTCQYFQRKRPQGVTLIELLVALVISLLGALAIMQVYIGSEAGKRATGSLSDAQSGGLIALYSIERDLQQAGLGFLNLNTLGCNLRSSFALNNRFLQPVSIVPAGAAIGHPSNLWGIPPGDANSDMLVIAVGDGGALVEGTRLALPVGPGEMLVRLENARGIQSGDFLLLGEAGQDCTLARATALPSASGDVTLDFATAAAYSLNAVVMHLGRAPSLIVYAVRNGALTRCDFMITNCASAALTNDPAVWMPVANDVVALAGQYGFDITAPANLRADAYCKTRVPASSNCPNPDTGLSAAPGADANQGVRACDWTRIPLVQLALVARSGQSEKDMVSPATLKLWPDSVVAPTTIGPDWPVADRHYRYRVARGAVALRNVIWMGAQPSC